MWFGRIMTSLMLHTASAIRIIVPILIQIIQVHGTEPQNAIFPPLPPIGLLENEDYRHTCIITIRSTEAPDTVRYSLQGKGANEEPLNLFTVNPLNGCVQVHSLLDREKTPSYSLKAVATLLDGTLAEEELLIPVIDKNDNPPVFSFDVSQSTGAVNESSAAGTYVMTITATDADEGVYAEITYSIVESGNMFSIDQETGQIYVKLNTLDRETQDLYTLTIKATDCKGCREGLSVTAKFVVKILDINDNIPRLETNYYEAQVMENAFSVTALRIKALDADVIHTDNWLAVFTIVSGNEAGYFSITTDPETNEGILVLNKAIDYEELKELNLQISVSNKAEYHSSVINQKRIIYPIKINVQNEREGPRFHPLVKVVHVSEERTSFNLKEVITTYKAIDTDTKQDATNVIYLKGEDEHNWITIDQKTAEIRLNKFPDRESKYLVNGTYYAKILCITEGAEATAFGTATGTIVIQVQDNNDNYPTLTSTYQTMCFEDNVVYVTAVDRDAFPNGAPFDFKVSPNTKEHWTVERLNDTRVLLRSKEILWPGNYKVFLVIRDLQGKAHADEQVLDLEVCSCTNHNPCQSQEMRAHSASLGPAAILPLFCLLPLLLLFFWCENTRTFKPMPCPPKQHIISYHTEGQGEDKKVPVLVTQTGDSGFKIYSNQEAKDPGHGSSGFLHEYHSQKVPSWVTPTEVDSGFKIYSNQEAKDPGHGSSAFLHCSQKVPVLVPPTEVDSGFINTSHQEAKGPGHGSGALAGLTLSEAFLHEYYSQKARCIDQLQCPDEAYPLVYGYEGQQSPVGSIDCCGFIQDDQDLDFLNDLGPKFKTLANICGSEVFEVQSSKVKVTAPPPMPAPHLANEGISAEIPQSVSVSKAEVNCMAALSARIQESIDSATCPATHLATSAVQLEENIITPPQTLLIQQPIVHCTAATLPVCVMDPKPHPILLVGPAANMSENLVMVERRDTTGGCAQLQGIGQGVLGVVENLHGAQGLILLGHGASAAGDPQQIIKTLGRREVVMVQTQKGMGSGSVKQINEIYGDTLTSGNVSLSETTSAVSGGLIQVVQVVPSQSHSSPIQ